MQVRIIQSKQYPNVHSVETTEGDVLRIFHARWDDEGLDSFLAAQNYAHNQGWVIVAIESAQIDD